MRSPTPSGATSPLLLSVRVLPRASRDEIARDGDGLRVHVTAPPVEGAANEALVALLARRLGLPKRAVAVVRGASARQKVVAIDGLTVEAVWQRLGL